jgi:hypothetical protein
MRDGLKPQEFYDVQKQDLQELSPQFLSFPIKAARNI